MHYVARVRTIMLNSNSNKKHNYFLIVGMNCKAL